jgi:uncharacterized membrane protein YhaH (DUF805 family)
MTQAATFGRRGAAKPPPPKALPTRPAMQAPSPRARAATAEAEESLGSHLLKLLFSFDGRMDRRTYRLCRVVANVVVLLSFLVLRDVIPKAAATNLALLLPIGLLMIGLYVVWIWSTLAMQVKRRHDRDKSWPWLFVGFIPIVGPFWVLIETCWLEGTPGYNQFDDPDKTAAATFA